MADRAIVFIDGDDWYHALRDAGIDDLGRINYKSLSEGLVGPRIWPGTRHYIGRVTQDMSPTLYADQRRFLESARQPAVTTKRTIPPNPAVLYSAHRVASPDPRRLAGVYTGLLS